MLGHMLRYDEDTPVLLALKFCLFVAVGSKEGESRINLLNVFEIELDVKF